MGRTEAPSTNRGRSRRTRRPPSAETTEKPSPVPAATIKTLEKLVQRHRSDDRVASWELGRLAGDVLGQTETSSASRLAIADLAEQIGLIDPPDPATPDKRRDESTLRQLMKFARMATKVQAKRLSQAKVAWRGIVYWQGVESDAHRAKLYEEIVSGLTNSTEIRDYIASRFKAPALPRSHVDLARNMANAQEAADRLVETLRNLNSRLEAKVAAGDATKPEKARLEASQRRLDDAVKEAARLARGTGACIGRFR